MSDTLRVVTTGKDVDGESKGKMTPLSVLGMGDALEEVTAEVVSSSVAVKPSSSINGSAFKDVDPFVAGFGLALRPIRTRSLEVATPEVSREDYSSAEPGEDDPFWDDFGSGESPFGTKPFGRKRGREFDPFDSDGDGEDEAEEDPTAKLLRAPRRRRGISRRRVCSHQSCFCLDHQL